MARHGLGATKGSFKKASKEDIKLLKSLPNFDAKVFEEITGIRIESEWGMSKHQKDNIQEMIDYCMEKYAKKSFYISLNDFYNKNCFLTEKQIEALENSYNRKMYPDHTDPDYQNGD